MADRAICLDVIRIIRQYQIPTEFIAMRRISKRFKALVEQVIEEKLVAFEQTTKIFSVEIDYLNKRSANIEGLCKLLQKNPNIGMVKPHHIYYEDFQKIDKMIYIQDSECDLAVLIPDGNVEFKVFREPDIMISTPVILPMLFYEWGARFKGKGKIARIQIPTLNFYFSYPYKLWHGMASRIEIGRQIRMISKEEKTNFYWRYKGPFTKPSQLHKTYFLEYGRRLMDLVNFVSHISAVSDTYDFWYKEPTKCERNVYSIETSKTYYEGDDYVDNLKNQKKVIRTGRKLLAKAKIIDKLIVYPSTHYYEKIRHLGDNDSDDEIIG